MAPCSADEICIATVAYPFYRCKCPTWRYGDKCQYKHGIPALPGGEIITVGMRDGQEVKTITEDGWKVSEKRCICSIIVRFSGSYPFL